MKKLDDAYLLELVAEAKPQHENLRDILPDLLSDIPSTARYARGFVDALLGSLGYEPEAMRLETSKVARQALRCADPMAEVMALAAANPLALTDAEAALRGCGLGVEDARVLSITEKGKKAARAFGHGRYAEADRLLARM